MTKYTTFKYKHLFNIFTDNMFTENIFTHNIFTYSIFTNIKNVIAYEFEVLWPSKYFDTLPPLAVNQ